MLVYFYKTDPLRDWGLWGPPGAAVADPEICWEGGAKTRKTCGAGSSVLLNSYLQTWRICHILISDTKWLLHSTLTVGYGLHTVPATPLGS